MSLESLLSRMSTIGTEWTSLSPGLHNFLYVLI